MPAKKQKGKDKSGDERILEFIKRLRQYYDHADFDFKTFPLGLPKKLPLKLGPETVGGIFIDWKEVFAKLYVTEVVRHKPPEMPEDKYIEELTVAFSTASPEARSVALYPFYSMIFHMFQYLPEKLTNAMVQLAAESHHRAVMDRAKERGIKTPAVSPSKFADSALKRERKAILARLPKLPRYSTKTKPAWQNPHTLRRYAALVRSRNILVQRVKQIFDDCEEAEEWTEDLKLDPDYQVLSHGVPQLVLNWAIKRVADENLSKREKEPLSIACEMTRREIGDLPPQQPPTLRTYYTKGLKLLKEDRTRG